MAVNEKRQRVNFTATKIISKPAVIRFQTKNGQLVTFKGHKDIPAPVRVSFMRKGR
ncbi:MAG: hypothetical protein WDN10_05110 [bacterium]